MEQVDGPSLRLCAPIFDAAAENGQLNMLKWEHDSWYVTART